MPAELHGWTLAVLVDNAPHDLGQCAAFSPESALEQAVQRATKQGLQGVCQAHCLESNTNVLLQHRFWHDTSHLEHINEN